MKADKNEIEPKKWTQKQIWKRNWYQEILSRHEKILQWTIERLTTNIWEQKRQPKKQCKKEKKKQIKTKYGKKMELKKM